MNIRARPAEETELKKSIINTISCTNCLFGTVEKNTPYRDTVKIQKCKI